MLYGNTMNSQNLKFINENGLVSVMNNSRWNALVEAITSNSDFRPMARFKFLRDSSAEVNFSFADWECVCKGDSSCIEWIEIDPIKRERRGQLMQDKETDFSKYIGSQLSGSNIPYSIESGKFRVWGYFYPGSQPDFV